MEAKTKDTWKPMVSLADRVVGVEEHEFFKEYVDCLAFNLHDLEVLKGQKCVLTL